MTEELHRTLTNWPANHIGREDDDCAAVVRARTAKRTVDPEPAAPGWLGGMLKRFFGKKK